MTEQIHHGTADGQVAVKAGEQKAEFLLFDNLASFSGAVEAETGLIFDFPSVSELNTHFLEATDQYLVLNLKGYDGELGDNLLFLTEEKAFLYARQPPPPEAFKTFEAVLNERYGKSTVLAFTTLNKVLDSYKARLETLIGMIKDLDDNFDYPRYRELVLSFEALEDRLDDIQDLLLKLEESGTRQVETRLISFDYSVLIAENQSLQGRCRRRLVMVKDLARDHELRATSELNRRIARLNDVVRKLTALTVILMIPTLIASHFGMNFVHMPELQVPWAYPAVLVSQVVFIVSGAIVFKKIGWL